MIIGLSVVDDADAMADDALVLALANPQPEVHPDEAPDAFCRAAGQR
ncbi:MAG TPA: hypothetical protein VFN87_13525 [Solirubrobacteraceae bacterium]|nr:hypothetical protein [Solirubrobacteraceae bacterium]